jgi:hypothetical protein
MNLIDYGVRSGGGIGDMIPKVSPKYSFSYFIGRFFYNMAFFILIVLIQGNIFLGIIVDTFAALRDKNAAIAEDKKNVCFICQMDRNQSLNKNIDFDRHTKHDHNMWNYVYFLAYLHINNPNDFNGLQNYVWKKLNYKDISWVPLAESSE